MPLNLPHYESTPILTGGELFDLIFLETLEEIHRRDQERKGQGVSPSKYQENQIPDMLAMHAIVEQFHNWLAGNLAAGIFRRINNFNQKGEAGVYRGEVFAHINNFGILRHYEDQGIIIPPEAYALIEKYAIKDKIEPEPASHTSAGGEKPDTSIPKITGWDQVTFCVLEDARLEIAVAGTVMDELPLKKKIPPYLWSLLFNIVAKGTPFDNETFMSGVFKKEYIPRLRKHLKSYFRHNTEPIPYNKKANQYQPQFMCESDFSQEIFSPQDATPSGVKRKIKNEKWSRDQQF